MALLGLPRRSATLIRSIKAQPLSSTSPPAGFERAARSAAQLTTAQTSFLHPPSPPDRPPHRTLFAAMAVRVNRRPRRQIPEDIASNEELHRVVAESLPQNYRFEVAKTLWRLREVGATKVALQLPEGLLMFGNALGEILVRFHDQELKVCVLGETTYGACCVDDLTAKALGADLLVHYGHSCLVPSSVTGPLKVLYVFVDIEFDPSHLVGCCAAQFALQRPRIVLAGTVQFLRSLNKAAAALRGQGWQVDLPQASPLSAGEVLGCTAPKIAAASDDDDDRVLVFVADGRFHLESAMIQNPGLPALRYDPYAKRLTSEGYDRDTMARRRQDAVRRARNATAVAVVLGTLGRQGSTALLARIRTLLRRANKRVLLVLASELDADLLNDLVHQNSIQAIVQICCPRLSIDWGHAILHNQLPLLSPYEAFAAFDPLTPFDPHTHYPMDFYAKDPGPWGNYFKGDAAKSDATCLAP